MKDYYAQAKALREQVAELDEIINHPIIESNPGDQEKADKLWQEHVELMKLVYPEPNAQDHIQVAILDMYRNDALVLYTSFADISRYHEAYDLLGWDYDLVSEQVGICECCDSHYKVSDGSLDSDGRGFCKRSCLLEDQYQRRTEMDQYEHDELYDYVFPVGDVHHREIPHWV